MGSYIIILKIAVSVKYHGIDITTYFTIYIYPTGEGLVKKARPVRVGSHNSYNYLMQKNPSPVVAK